MVDTGRVTIETVVAVVVFDTPLTTTTGVPDGVGLGKILLPGVGMLCVIIFIPKIH